MEKLNKTDLATLNRRVERLNEIANNGITAELMVLMELSLIRDAVNQLELKIKENAVKEN